jgi:hypothetical protein
MAETMTQQARRIARTRRTKAQRGDEALAPYLETDDPSTAVTDLLSDLRHYCDREKVDFGWADEVAHRNYLSELEGEA